MVRRLTRQTAAPLEHRSLDAAAREAVGIVDMIRDGMLTLDTPYQRASVWDDEQRIGLIKSFLLGIPIPAMIWNDRTCPAWENANPGYDGPPYAMIDGKQRAETAIAWYADKFAVPASWFEPGLVYATERTGDGPYVRFSGLTIVGQRFFKRLARFPVAEAKVGSLATEANVYLLVNAAGTSQTADDLNRARAIAEGS